MTRETGVCAPSDGNAAADNATARTNSVVQHRLVLAWNGHFRVTLEHPDAGVPGKDRLIVARRPHGFGDLVRPPRVAEPLARNFGRPERAAMQLGARATLTDDPRVIDALVFVRQARQHLART